MKLTNFRDLPRIFEHQRKRENNAIEKVVPGRRWKKRKGIVRSPYKGFGDEEHKPDPEAGTMVPLGKVVVNSSGNYSPYSRVTVKNTKAEKDARKWRRTVTTKR